MESSTKKATSMIQQFEQKLTEKNFTLVPVQLGPVKKLEILLKVDPKNTSQGMEYSILYKCKEKM